MAPKRPAKFYSSVTIRPGQGGYAVLLDGKPVNTPGGAVLELPTRALADAIATEWRSQDLTIHPETMGLTKLANTAIDRIGPNRDAVIEQTLGFGKSDLLCYRAAEPAELVDQQSQAWDHLLDWASERFGVVLAKTVGVAFIEQPKAALDRLHEIVAVYDDFRLAALSLATAQCGSLILGLALMEGRLSSGLVFTVAHLDDLFQIERWGSDAEAELRLMAQAAELNDVAQFLRLLAG